MFAKLPLPVALSRICLPIIIMKVEIQLCSRHIFDLARFSVVEVGSGLRFKLIKMLLEASVEGCLSLEVKKNYVAFSKQLSRLHSQSRRAAAAQCSDRQSLQ